MLKNIQVALSANGQASTRTNTLIVTDTAVSLQAVADILKQVDSRNEEVQIEMKFIEFDTNDFSAFGINFLWISRYDIGTIGAALLPFDPFLSQALNFTAKSLNMGNVSGALSLRPLVP